MLDSWKHRTVILLVSVILVIFCPRAAAVYAQGGVDFKGTVLADPAAGKLIVKKDEGGTRFTFVVNEKTQVIVAARASSCKSHRRCRAPW